LQISFDPFHGQNGGFRMSLRSNLVFFEKKRETSEYSRETRIAIGDGNLGGHPGPASGRKRVLVDEAAIIG
jgi:hypothetical protein